MNTYTYTVEVEAENLADADQVMRERVFYEEQIYFEDGDYTSEPLDHENARTVEYSINVTEWANEEDR